MWAAVQVVCFAVIVWWLVKHAFPTRPDPQKQKLEEDRRHKELLDALAKLERQSAAPPVPPPLPTFNSAERARVLGLGKLRDGEKRHPILNEPYTPVANKPRV
jgi:hypothetical protein